MYFSSNWSSGKSFSPLARIKSYGRSSETQRYVVQLLFANENDLSVKLDYEWNRHISL